MERKENWFKRKKITAIFAAVAFLGGFLFLNNGGITGNVIFNREPSLDVLSLIGLALIFCSAILTIYTVKKR